MENLENAITDVTIVDENIVITYDNGAIETLPKTVDTYKRMYEMWVKDEPVFISDKFTSFAKIVLLILLICVFLISNDFINKEKSGLYKHYYENGQLRYEVLYVNDKKEGIYKYYKKILYNINNILYYPNMLSHIKILFYIRYIIYN